MISGVKLSSSLGYEHQTFKESLEILMNKNINVDPIMTKKIELDHIVEDGLEALIGDPSQAKILVKVSGEM